MAEDYVNAPKRQNNKAKSINNTKKPQKSFELHQ